MSSTPFEPPPRVVLFDLDDTLCDYAAARNERLRIAFTLPIEGIGRARDGLDVDQMIADSIRMHPHGSDHFEQIFELHGIGGPEAARAAAEWYRTNRFHGLDLFPDAQSVLHAIRNALSRAGTGAMRPLGVITNGPAEVQRAKLDLLELTDLVDFAVISEEFGVAKPDPAIFHEALRLAGVSPEEALFVGDSPEFDMAGARAVGIPSVWLNKGSDVWTDLNWAPDREIRSLNELPRLIEAGR